MTELIKTLFKALLIYFRSYIVSPMTPPIQQPVLKNRWLRIAVLVPLVFALLFVQSMQVHMHTYSHDDAATLGHVHHDQLHSEFVFSHQQHADELTQVDLSYSGFINNLSVNVLPLLFVFAVLILALADRQYSLIRWDYFRRVLALPWRGRLQPPLRAPPLLITS